MVTWQGENCKQFGFETRGSNGCESRGDAGFLLVFVDLCLILKCQPDVVEAVEQAIAAKFVDLKTDIKALVISNRFICEVYRKRVTRDVFGIFDYALNRFFIKTDGQQAIF